MKFNITILTALIVIIIFGCKGESENSSALAPNAHEVTAEEVLYTSSYAYVKVDDGESEHWIAITKREVEEGETYYFLDGMEMKNFPSKELNRTFESIIFVDNFSSEPYLAQAPETQAMPPGSKKSVTEKQNISVEPVEGGVTIAELFGDMDKYKAKTILVRGVVTKFNSGIMGKNWVHIQDGTESGGKYDLTLTTDDNVAVGDLVTFEGSVALNKDFGFGYSYEVLLELAKLQK